MADSVVHIGENSQEGVAFKLFAFIANYAGDKPREPKWVLDTYAECLQTVRSPGGRKPVQFRE
jgi:hypothetical protein